MNKRDAKRLAEAGTLTVRELRAMVAAARGKRATGRINPFIPYDLLLDTYDAALATRDQNGTMSGLVSDPYTRRMRPSRDAIITRNILVDCAP